MDRDELEERLEENRQARLANLRHAQQILKQLRTIAAECENDEQFLARMDEIRALQKQQQVTADRAKQLGTEQRAIEAQLEQLGDRPDLN